jgi:hypothetical protein
MSRPVGEVLGVRTVSVPSPFFTQLGLQCALQHGYDVLAQHREELPAVEVTTCCDIQALGSGVWRDDEIGTGCESVPTQG